MKSETPPVVIYDDSASGHHSMWLTRIAQAFVQNGRRVVIVAPLQDERMAHWQAILPASEQVHWQQAPAALERDGAHVVLCAAEQLRKQQGDHTKLFFPYLDSLFKRILLERGWCPDWPEQLNGIWMGPRSIQPPSRWQCVLSNYARQAWKEHAGLKALRGQGRLGWIGLLDERLVVPLQEMGVCRQAEAIPDFAEPMTFPLQEDARKQWGIQGNAIVLLHFGVADRRKGLADVVAAMRKMPEDSPVFLLRAGKVGKDASLRVSLDQLEQAGRARVLDRFVEEDELPSLLVASDWVLLPYRGHRDSSGLLSMASQAGRPVIASDFGVVGCRVRKANTGLLYSHKSVSELTRCLMQVDKTRPLKYASDLDRDYKAHDVGCLKQLLGDLK